MKKNQTAQPRRARQATKNSTCILRLTSSCWGLALLQAHAGPCSASSSINLTPAPSRARYHLFSAESFILPRTMLVRSTHFRRAADSKQPPIQQSLRWGARLQERGRPHLGARAASPLSSSGPSAAEWMAAIRVRAPRSCPRGGGGWRGAQARIGKGLTNRGPFRIPTPDERWLYGLGFTALTLKTRWSEWRGFLLPGFRSTWGNAMRQNCALRDDRIWLLRLRQLEHTYRAASQCRA